MTPNNINPNSANSDTKQEEHITFSVHDLIQTVIANWYWFVIPVFVCVGCGYIYILRTPKIYSRTANILVKDSRKGGDTDLATLSDLAGLSQRRNVDNEIYILQSRRLMTEVVKQLGLTVQYETKEGLRPQDLYGQSPIAVEFINDNDRQGFRFEVSLRPDSIVKLNYFEIFGELFMLIEKDKRGIELQLLYSDENFSVPANVYIIGMMNTADRSLAMLDYALRRRFSFFTMKPGFNTPGFQVYQDSLKSDAFNKLIACVKQLNSKIVEDISLGEGFCIGHSYFCGLTPESANTQTLSSIVEYELIPLLKEYWFDEPAKIVDWSDRLRSAVK